MMYTIGEVLIDLIAREEGDLGNVRVFEKHPGGAPANVAVGLSRLGIRPALISKVGDDPFGDFLVEKLKEEGVETKFIVKDKERHTGVVFVQLIGAKPQFILYDGVAYFNLKEEDIDWSFLDNAELLHFGSVLLAREPARSTLFKILKRARNVIVSYDVNIREDLWRGKEDEMTDYINKAIDFANIVKVSEEEFKYIREVEDKLLIITRGERGCTIIWENMKVEVPTFKVTPVDTTGAGDAFMAGFLASLNYMGKLENFTFSRDELIEAGKFANLVASLSTTKRGAWSAPTLEEVKKHGSFSFLP
ncbi:sugar kinase [Pyrococcus sp. NA2]|uniref:carbohydrate kinase family protein n=1 Tax=Pyrococcus sp. (strain NA2) TaxID=342949 RepID=UPI000209AA99|nr:carbohydrate kinase [Pyrococcus sp. NA2]AEC52587.1 sugar kinase [Pyrococcus sp. NA2]